MTLRLKRPLAIAIAMLLALVSVVPAMAYHEGDGTHAFANQHFQNRWARTDKPVADGTVARTWIWGPEPYTPGMQEPYAESPGDTRQVQYFDKSRMEINNPAGNTDSLWHVTNGLLVVEMVEGRFQTGDNQFDESPDPAEQRIAGDPDDTFGPTYADIHDLALRAAAARAEGTAITHTIVNGQVTTDSRYAGYNVTAAHRVQVPGIDHTVASVFWDFLNSEATVWVNGSNVTDDLFLNSYYPAGYPITEAYWANVLVGGTQQDVLWQCFERRCLTYTPGNEPGWRVEAGNVGQHYYRWRHGSQEPETETVDLFLVAIGDNGQSGREIGCDDSLVAVEAEIAQHDTLEERITAAIEALFTYDDDELHNPFIDGSGDIDLEVESVTVTDGTAVINLTGELTVGGVCDEPRVTETIRDTAAQFEGVDNVVILHDGGPVFEPQATPTDGIIAIFDVNGTQFRVWVTNEDTIDDIFALQAGTSTANIPNGTILAGPGEQDHNAPWSWHLDPDDIQMAEVTIELCDGNPAFVEANVDYFVNTVGSYCPWSAELVEIRDYRTP